MGNIMEMVYKHDDSQKIWVILGTKRGGTSFLAMLLGNNGVKIDTCGNEHNEDLAFVNLNNKILEYAGGDWNNLPPDEEIGWAVAAYSQEIESLIKLKSESGQDWGWKDPRQGAVMKHYIPYLPGDVYIVSVFRKPDYAARSMQRTWAHLGFTFEFCRKVITDYHVRILDALGEFVK